MSHDLPQAEIEMTVILSWVNTQNLKITYICIVEIVNFLSLKIKMTFIVIFIGALDKSHDQIHEKNQTT